MTHNHEPSISAVVAVYETEDYIGEALDAILGQTRPPDEVVVVDDGSTDGTARILEGYGTRIRVLRQANAGYPSAMNRAIREARGDYVALCGADDVWEPTKLEWQVDAIRANADAAVLFGHAVFFGAMVGDHARPTGSGMLENRSLAADLFRTCVINTPCATIRRDLFDHVGWFPDGFLADDYDFFYRAIRAGFRFYYDPRTLVRYRRHERNITNDGHEIRRAWTQVRLQNADLVDDRGLIDEVLGPELFRIGRRFVDEGRRHEARSVFLRSLAYRRGNVMSANARALAWIVLLGLPSGAQGLLGDAPVRLARALDGLRGGRDAALP